VVDHLYKRVIEAFGVLFVAVLLIVLASRLLGAHLAQRAARRTSAGGQGALIVASGPGRGAIRSSGGSESYTPGGADLDGGWDIASSLSRGPEATVVDRRLGSDK
jgi:hypothetical protein